MALQSFSKNYRRKSWGFREFVTVCGKKSVKDGLCYKKAPFVRWGRQRCNPNAPTRGLDRHAGRGHLARRIRGPPSDRRAHPYVLLSETLAGLQAQLPTGLTRAVRQPADPPEVVEVWFPVDALDPGRPGTICLPCQATPCRPVRCFLLDSLSRFWVRTLGLIELFCACEIASLSPFQLSLHIIAQTIGLACNEGLTREPRSGSRRISANLEPTA